MMSTSYRIGVNSPCSGQQIVSSSGTNLWVGGAGSFQYAIIALNANADAFGVTVYESNSSNPCFPIKYYEQVTPDPTDPEGVYGLMVDDEPDTDAGECGVTPWP